MACRATVGAGVDARPARIQRHALAAVRHGLARRPSRRAGAARAADVDGNAVIRAPAGPSDIVIRTTDRLAGAIDSLTWNGQEFINSSDHGRQLQSAAFFADTTGPVLTIGRR